MGDFPPPSAKLGDLWKRASPCLPLSHWSIGALGHSVAAVQGKIPKTQQTSIQVLDLIGTRHVLCFVCDSQCMLTASLLHNAKVKNWPSWSRSLLGVKVFATSTPGSIPHKARLFHILLLTSARIGLVFELAPAASSACFTLFSFSTCGPLPLVLLFTAHTFGGAFAELLLTSSVREHLLDSIAIKRRLLGFKRCAD